MNLGDDDFTLFGLPQRQALEAGDIDARRRALQAEVHPDRFAAQGAGAQRVAMQWAVRVNEAYQRLRDPLSRGAQLCALRGSPVDGERPAALPPAFLQQQMAWRESLDEAADAAAVQALAAAIDVDRGQRLQRLQTVLDDGGTAPEAASQVRELMFLDRLRQEIDRRLDRLEASR